jgi:23S rRNA (guanosine2251-2'-O)-methyltransferase
MAGHPRKAKSKKGATKGTGGLNRRMLARGNGRSRLPAAEREGHPAYKRAQAAARAEARRPKQTGERPELLVGRNPVAEALKAGVPATALYVALGIELDNRVTDAVKLAAGKGLSVLEVSRSELDRMTNGVLHQGIALQVPPYRYLHPDDLLDRVTESGRAGLVVALDGVTDPRNLGAVVRSAAAFGADGVLVPQRRAAGMTATAWRTSAGAAARLPIAQCVNLVRTLKDYQQAGLVVAGLDADGTVMLDKFEAATDPLVLVVGSEGRGLSRLVAATCDVTVAIPMDGPTESLNASVAAAVALAEISRRRKTH